MALPGLTQFLSPFPSYPLTTEIRVMIAAIAQAAESPPSHIIAVDAQQRPLGALPVGQLCTYSPAKATPAPAVEAVAGARLPSASLGATDCAEVSREPQFIDYQSRLDPIGLVSAQATVADLGATLPPSASTCWVAVNDQGQYQGVINATAVLGWLLTHRSDLKALEASPGQPLSILAPTSARERHWVIAISHALKTPLTSLLGLSTLLLDHRVGSLNERQSRYALLMRRAIRKLIRMVNQLVDWMRLESGQMALDLAPIDLPSLADALIPNFVTGWLPDAATPPAWVQQFTLSTVAGPPSIMADRLRLQQSLHGVLDYWLQQGAEPRGLTLERWGAWLGITLRAIHPDPEVIPAYPWTEEEGIEPTADGLESLGLALARRLCQHHQGELTGFWSRTYGYQVTLLLPVDPESFPPNSATVLVLLVSARGGLVDQVYGQLLGTGHRLLVAAAWQEALNLIGRLAPAAILIDHESLTIAPALALGEIAKRQVPLPLMVVLGDVPDPLTASQAPVLPIAALADHLLPTLAQLTSPSPAISEILPLPLTLLLLRRQPSPLGPAVREGLSDQWRDELQRYQCRLLQADDLAQASLLCRVWQPHAIVLDRQDPLTTEDWAQLARLPDLAQQPLVTLTPPPLEIPSHLKLLDGSVALAQPLPQGVVALIQTIQAAQTHH